MVRYGRNERERKKERRQNEDPIKERTHHTKEVRTHNLVVNALHIERVMLYTMEYIKTHAHNKQTHKGPDRQIKKEIHKITVKPKGERNVEKRKC